MPTARFVIVEDAAFTIIPPVKYESKDEVAAAKDVLPETVRPVRVPTDVREEEVMEDPSVVPFKTFTPFMLYARPEAKLIAPET